MSSPSMRRRFDAGLIAVLLVIPACSDDGTGPQGQRSASVDSLVAAMPSWSQYAPPVPDANAPTGAATTVDEVVEVRGEGGVIESVTYTCTETPYSLSRTPDEIVMYQPNASVMWVGALIQGNSYKGGLGSLSALSIPERDTLVISIDLLTGDNSAVVPNPSLSTVNSAIGGLIQRAADAGHLTGSSVSYEEHITHSVEQAALQMGLSARYLGGSAKSQLSTSRAANERTYTAHFVQKMFTIAIELPARPSDFFSADFTQSKLQQLMNAGSIGPNNPPVYIASVTYGRMLTYTLTSTHSEDRIRAAISASYNGVVGGASGYTEAELRETLSQQKMTVATLGGDAQNVLNLIASGNLKDYFKSNEPVSLTTARPISYQLNYLGDNQVAQVSETSSYTLRECEPKPSVTGRFDFLPIASGPSLPIPYSVFTGDFNGDGRGDLLWNHLLSGTNHVAVGLGAVAGSFDIQPAVQHTMTPPEGWANGYTTHIGDFNGDGRDDIMWNRVRGGGANRVYIAFSNGNGTFTFQSERTHPDVPAWNDSWKTFVGDLTGDGRADIIWNSLGESNVTYTAVTTSDSTFAYSARMTHPAQGFQPYVTHILDNDGDGDDDLIFNRTTSDNAIHFGRSNGNGTLNLSMPHQAIGSAAGWQDYVTRIGDINRDGRRDMIWIRAINGQKGVIQRAFGETNGRFRHVDHMTTREELEILGTMELIVGDFNGDGSDDIIFDDIGVGRNYMIVGLGNLDGGFNFTPAPQEHTASAGGEDWTAFRGGIVVVDVNGDCRDDVVWNERAVSNRIHVALARGIGSCSAPGAMRRR